MWAEWFLWAYLALLLLLPLVRTMAQHMTSNMFVYLIALQILLIGILPPAFALLQPSEHPMLKITAYLPFYSETNNLPYGHMAWLFYVLTGYFLAHRLSLAQLTRPRLWILAAAALLCFGTEACLLERIRIARGLSSIVELSFPSPFWMPCLPLPCSAWQGLYAAGLPARHGARSYWPGRPPACCCFSCLKT